MHSRSLMLVFLLLCGLAACGGPRVYRDESFDVQSPFQQVLPVRPEAACEAAQRALLSQGYRLEISQPLSHKSRKDFQPESEVSSSIEFYVVCRARDGGALLFANAVQTTYELKKSSQSAGISIPSAGSLSLPFGKTTESLVKTAEETVADEEFYQRFFELVRSFLGLPEAKTK